MAAFKASLSIEKLFLKKSGQKFVCLQSHVSVKTIVFDKVISVDLWCNSNIFA